jgi:hypothetical protein
MFSGGADSNGNARCVPQTSAFEVNQVASTSRNLRCVFTPLSKFAAPRPLIFAGRRNWPLFCDSPLRSVQPTDMGNSMRGQGVRSMSNSVTTVRYFGSRKISMGSVLTVP